MNDFEMLKEKLASERPAAWESIPDIQLYMDQVLQYLRRQCIEGGEGEPLTSAMVNNYMKKELLPRAKGKKYDREHIAYLTAICSLKQVLTVSETGALLSGLGKDRNVRSFYEKYCEQLDKALLGVADAMEKDGEGAGKDKIYDLILQLAVGSYAQKLACENLLKIVSPSK